MITRWSLVVDPSEQCGTLSPDSRVVAVGFTTLHLSVTAPPVDEHEALLVAAEHFAFCPDNIFGNTFPVFVHFRIPLWVPEVGGASRPLTIRLWWRKGSSASETAVGARR